MSVAIFNMAGGAPAALSVTAYANVGILPASAAAGDIAVITALSLTSAYAGATAPSTPSTGNIWVWTGSTSRQTIPLTDKITLFPRAVYRWSGSAWVLLVSYVYSGSAWVELSLYLYDAGSYILASSSSLMYNNRGGWSQNTSNIYLWVHDGSYSSQFNMGFSPYVDLTNVSTIKMYIWHSACTSSSERFNLHVASSLSTTNVATTYSASTGYKTLSLDVSALSGYYYICASVSAAIGNYSNGYIYQVYLER